MMTLNLVAFFVILATRKGHGILGGQNCGQLNNTLVEAVKYRFVVEAATEDRQALAEFIQELLATHFDRYFHLPLLAKGDGLAEGKDMMWEFGKIMADLAGFSMDIWFISVVMCRLTVEIEPLMPTIDAYFKN